MNNQKILRKRSFFKCISILFFIVLLSAPSWAYVSNEDTKFHIFDNSVAELESKIFESLQTTKNFWATIEPVVDVIELLASANPVTAAVAGVVSVMQSLLAKESDWTALLAKVIAVEQDRHAALQKVNDMISKIKTIYEKLPVLSNKNPKKENRITMATVFHTQINDMLNFFDQNDSIFKNVPLIGAPILLALSQVVVLFEPHIKKLNPFEAKHPELSCKVRNTMLHYHPRTVNARLEQMRLESHVVSYEDEYMLQPSFTFSKYSDYVMTLKNFNAYISTMSPGIRCKTGCLRDEFGEGEYIYEHKCIKDYAVLLRHRVKELFYYDILNELCDDPPEKTGFGWLTIKLRHLRAHGKLNGTDCDFGTLCDPFVKVWINNDTKLVTPKMTNTCCYDVARTFTSERIFNNSDVSVEVWDADENGEAELLLRRKGNINSFLQNGHIYLLRTTDKHVVAAENYSDTVSFWRDEYNNTINMEFIVHQQRGNSTSILDSLPPSFNLEETKKPKKNKNKKIRSAMDEVFEYLYQLLKANSTLTKSKKDELKNT